MNGATSKSFMRNLSGSDFTSHKSKRRFFEAADWNKAVGMQKGKNLFHLPKKEGEELGSVEKEPVKEEKEDTKVKGNLNYTPEKATIVAMKRGCYKK